MRGALLNPIRFYDQTLTPDGLTIFPIIDNQELGEQVSYGISASPDCIRNHIGLLRLQFLNPDNTPKTFDIFKLNDSNVFEAFDDVESEDISPTGWTGYQIHLIEKTLTKGAYYLILDNYKSDVFQIVDEIEDLIKIEYSNSVNDFGCIFSHTFLAYFRGNVQSGDIKNEIESFTSDRGIPVKLKATPSRTITVRIFGLSLLYKDLVDMIFSLDTILINGVAYENSEPPQWENIDGSDIGHASIKMVKKVNDYYHG